MEEWKEKKVPDELQGPGASREQTITALSRCTTLFSSIISVHLHNTRGDHQTQALKTGLKHRLLNQSGLTAISQMDAKDA